MRETLRLYAPVAATGRTATEDCVIPLAEPIIDRNGVKKTEILCVPVYPIVLCIALCNVSIADRYYLMQYRQEHSNLCSHCTHHD